MADPAKGKKSRGTWSERLKGKDGPCVFGWPDGEDGEEEVPGHVQTERGRGGGRAHYGDGYGAGVMDTEGLDRCSPGYRSWHTGDSEVGRGGGGGTV